MPISLEEAMKLSGTEDWTLTPSQQRFLIASTSDLLKEHPPEWFKENRVRLQTELEMVFKEV